MERYEQTSAITPERRELMPRKLIRKLAFLAVFGSAVSAGAQERVTQEREALDAQPQQAMDLKDIVDAVRVLFGKPALYNPERWATPQEKKEKTLEQLGKEKEGEVWTGTMQIDPKIKDQIIQGGGSIDEQEGVIQFSAQAPRIQLTGRIKKFIIGPRNPDKKKSPIDVVFVYAVEKKIMLVALSALQQNEHLIAGTKIYESEQQIAQAF